MKLRSALLAATVLAAPVAARAEAISGLYIGAGAGANFLQDQDISTSAIAGRAFGIGANYSPGNPANTTGPSNAKFETGYRLLGSIGYGLGNGLRVEVEGDYFQNKFYRVSGSASNGGRFSPNEFQNSRASIGGDEQKYGGFLNVLYDFDPNVLGFANVFGYLPFPVSPYIGVGAGYLQTKYNNVRVFPQDRSYFVRSTGTDGGFAYQAIVGTAVPISAVPGLALTVEYRFTGTSEDRDLNAQAFFPNRNAGTVVQAHDSDFNHSVMVGFRYAFNAAPPPPPPMAPPVAQQPATARTYLVFFDWDRADLTDRARQIVAQAAQASTRVAVTRIEVNGYTDSSGTARYNLGLSQRRAQTVAAELVRDGVSRSAISIQGFGETHPLVPTAQGVREPQNRRVEIILR